MMNAARSRAFSLLVTASALLSAGCYYYQPAELEPPPQPHAEVRLLLKPEHASGLANEMQGTQASLAGRVIRWDQAEVFMQAAAWTEAATPNAGMQTLKVPRDDILAVEIKRLDRRKTALLVGGIGAVTALFIQSRLADWVGLRGDSNDPPNTDAARVPAFHIDW